MATTMANETPLHRAAAKGHCDVVALLLGCGMDDIDDDSDDDSDDNSGAPSSSSSSSSSSDSVRGVHRGSVDKVREDGQTALHLAALFGRWGPWRCCCGRGRPHDAGVRTTPRPRTTPPSRRAYPSLHPRQLPPGRPPDGAGPERRAARVVAHWSSPRPRRPPRRRQRPSTSPTSSCWGRRLAAVAVMRPPPSEA